MQLFNQSKRVPNNGHNDLDSASYGSIESVNSIDLPDDVALISTIKAELEQAGLLAATREQNKGLQFEKLAQILQSTLNDQLSTKADQLLRNERQRLLSIVEQMRQAPDLDTLFATTVSELQQHL